MLPQAETVEALVGEINHWGWFALILNPVWFLQLPIVHDGHGGHCEECKQVRF